MNCRVNALSHSEERAEELLVDEDTNRTTTFGRNLR